MGKYVEITDDNFKKEVEQSSLPVLVDFWAPWCAPCRMIAPVIEELAEEYDGKIKVAKYNTEDSSQKAMELQVVSIPSIIIFKDGKEVDRSIGVMPKEKLKEFIDNQI